MTNEELAVAAKSGDKNSIEQLWTACHKFIAQQAGRWIAKRQLKGIDTDDLIQAGYFALLKALEYYDPQKGYKFITYLDKPLLTAFQRQSGVFLPDRDALSHSVSIETPVAGAEDVLLADTLADTSEDLNERLCEEEYAAELHSTLEKAIELLLDDQERQIIDMYYFKSLSTEQISVALGYTVARVHTVRRNALKRLRRPLDNPYYEELKSLYNDRFGASSCFDGYSEGLKGTGLSSFIHSGLSSVERAAQKHMDFERRQKNLFSLADTIFLKE